jgi:hypothetical protein
LTGRFYRTMKLTYRTLLHAIIMLEVVSSGCRSEQRSDPGFKETINQFDSSGKKQGPWILYDDTILVAKGSYAGGRQDGLWTYYYRNGQMKEEGHYDRGLKNGIWVEWYPDGELMWKGSWEKGKRQLEYSGAKADLKFIGDDHPDHVLARDSTYPLRIRIQNIPTNHLFVEVNSGTITREGDTDLFMLRTSSDTILTMAIGYAPDLEFKDFRNLVSEIQFRIR